MGTIQKHGKENFQKVDYQMPLNFASLAESCKVHHFAIVTSEGADKNSMIPYLRMKGRIEESIMASNITNKFFFRPGAIIDRVHENDSRPLEKIAKFIPFIEKIHVSSLARGVLGHTLV